MSRLSPMLVWCLLVLAGLLVLVWGPDRKPSPIASRTLARNTLLLPADVTYPGFVGRYVAAPDGVKQGAVLRASDIADQPALLDGPQGKLLLSVSISRAAVLAGLNAGSALQLCGKAPVSYGAVTIQAIRCDADKPGSSCASLVDVPTTIAGDLATKVLKDQTATNELRLAASCD
jgi:hypothetical protein